MIGTKKLHFLLHSLFLILRLSLTNSTSEDTNLTNICGKIQTQNSNLPYPLNNIVFCKSHKLYFKTSLGIFPISSINYTTKILTISQPSCSQTHNYLSPRLLSSALPSPPQPNSLFLFNCSIKKHNFSPITHNYTFLNSCGKFSSPCLVIENIEKLDLGFHPRELNCSHYSPVYRRSLNDDEYELGTRVSFDVPDHVPTICNECEKANGNCGVGLRCVCHPKDCRDKVISQSGSMVVAGYYQVPIALEDQEKTTFTCPFGTFSFRRLPFGLCNASVTFQRCMMSIFRIR